MFTVRKRNGICMAFMLEGVNSVVSTPETISVCK